MSNIDGRLDLLRKSGVFTPSQLGGSFARPLQADLDTEMFNTSAESVGVRSFSAEAFAASSPKYVAQQHDGTATMKKYKELQRQYGQLDKVSRAALAHRDEVVAENKALKFEAAKLKQKTKLHETEIARLQSQIVLIQASMTQFAAQAKRDIEEAASGAAKRERTGENHGDTKKKRKESKTDEEEEA